MPGSVIVAGARTPVGKLSGALAGFSAADLGGIAIKAALERAGVRPEQVDYVLMGQVLQAGAGQITARQAAVKAGIPVTTPSTTVNKVCLSGLNSIYLADQMIAAGDADIVVAGGQESMTNAPYLLPEARAGLRMGDKTIVDSMMYDGLFCAFDVCAMGAGTERYLKAKTVARDRQDAFAAASHERASAAQKEGRLADEIVSVEVPQRRGDPILVDTDEGVRPGTTVDNLAKLKPAFEADGTITAGNASQISDGGAAVVVMSRARADQLGVTPLGEFVSYGQVAGPDASLLTQPSRARPSVSSSAYSRSPPTGRPLAMRVTRRPRGFRRRARYMAVASPSRLGLVQRITSATPSVSILDSSSRTRSWSGPMPSMGLMAPWRTWYCPRNSWVFSTATMSRGSSTTQTKVGSRLLSVHSSHSSPSDTLKQRVQKRMRSFTAEMAAASRRASSGDSLRRWKAMRCADLGPMPGRRPSSCI